MEDAEASITARQQTGYIIGPKDAFGPESPDASRDLPISRAPEPAVVTKIQNEHHEPAKTWRLKTILESAAVIIGIAVAIIYGLQLDQMIESNKLTRDSLIANSRAWISPVNANITSEISKNAPLEFSITYTNSGRSPALDVHPVYSLDKIPSSKLADNSINDFIEGKDVCEGVDIKPGAQVAYPELPDTFIFKVGLPGWIDDGVISGDTTMLARMCFVYKTMGQVHHTAFCYYYRVGASPANKQMNVCPVGSHAD